MSSTSSVWSDLQELSYQEQEALDMENPGEPSEEEKSVTVGSEDTYSDILSEHSSDREFIDDSSLAPIRELRLIPGTGLHRLAHRLGVLPKETEVIDLTETTPQDHFEYHYHMAHNKLKRKLEALELIKNKKVTTDIECLEYQNHILNILLN